MARLDRSRPDTPLERQIRDAIIAAAAENVVDLDDVDWDHLTIAMREAAQESGRLVCDTLVETMQRAIEHEESGRLPFEERLFRHWGRPLDLLHALLIASREAGGNFLLETRRARRGTTTTEVLAQIHARCCLVAAEGLTLLRSGYASGANARWRSLHELAVVAFLIAEHGDDLAERFLLHAEVSGLKLARLEYEHAARLGIAPLASDLAARERAVAALGSRFGAPFLTEYGWAADVVGNADPKFSQIEQLVNLGHLRPYYRLASGPIHAGPSGMLEDLGAVASRGEILLSGPSNTGLRIPGQGIAIALSQATTAVLMRDVTAERVVYAFTLLELSTRCNDAFAQADDDVERLVAISHGHRARLRVFIRRGQVLASLGASRWHGDGVRGHRRHRRRDELRGRPPDVR